MALDARQRMKREASVKEWLEQGMSINQIAGELGVSQQSVHNFLRRRGWKTKEALRRSGGEVRVEEDRAAAERRARRAAMKETVDRSGTVSQKG